MSSMYNNDKTRVVRGCRHERVVPFDGGGFAGMECIDCKRPFLSARELEHARVLSKTVHDNKEGNVHHRGLMDAYYKRRYPSKI